MKLHKSRERHTEFTFGSMQEHVEEIRELYDARDGHWKAEAVDLAIHCLTLLRSHDVGGREIEALFARRYGRFKEKIGQAIEAGSRTNKGEQ